MLTATRFLEPAEVLGTIDDGIEVRVAGEARVARSAIAETASVGDEVLVAGEEDLYVVGILRRIGPRTIRVSPGDRVRLVDDRGALLFEYGDGYARVAAPRGDLELVAPRGAVKLRGAHGVSVAGPSLDIDAERIDAKAKRVRLRTERLESVAKTVISKAANVYTSVENLAQLLAGRVRTLVKGSCQLHARKTRIVSEKDTRIYGEKIHLG